MKTPQTNLVKKSFAGFGQRARAGSCEATAVTLRQAGNAPRGGDSQTFAAAFTAAEKVAHYEIASHGCLRAWAAEPGNQPAAQFLPSIQGEEKVADQVLTGQDRARLQETAGGNGLPDRKRGHLWV